MAVVEAPAPFIVTKVKAPLVSKGKFTTSLARGEILNVGVQVVAPDGGETNLHSHPGTDSTWMVLDGKAIFYTVNDKVVAELDREELVFIPQGVPYWFKAGSEKPLVILHITARTPGLVGPTRIDYEGTFESKGYHAIPGAIYGE